MAQHEKTLISILDGFEQDQKPFHATVPLNLLT
jgi:hypothetical protein